jgi:hypothetical protein
MKKRAAKLPRVNGMWRLNMRNWMVIVALFTPLAMAQTAIEVSSNSLMRLPSSASVVVLERLHIADHGTLFIPAGVTELRVGELRLGREARLAIAPGEHPLRLEAAAAELASGVQINARGAAGSNTQSALPGRHLHLRLDKATVADLLIDARGGQGTPGYVGLAGADGQAGGCAWGEASRGHDGLDGGNGQTGAPGAQVRLEVPHDFPIDQLQVRLDGGAGGPAGAAGAGGKGGASKGCWLYNTAAAGSGKPGEVGRAGEAGPAGAINVIRF